MKFGLPCTLAVTAFVVVSSASAAPLKQVPRSVVAIGGSPCFDFAETYGLHKRMTRGDQMPLAQKIGVIGAYADFLGTLGGYTARVQMEKGLERPPFASSDEAMQLTYEVCKANPKFRYLEAVDQMLRGRIK